MDYLLDSDTVIDVLKERGLGLARFEKVKDKKLFLSVVSWMEIEYGIKKAMNLEKKQNVFDRLLSYLKVEILPLDLATGSEFIKIRFELENKKSPLPFFDLLIGATAIVHNLTLVTGNIKHFSRIKELDVLN